jgi:uncharacterized protein with HEPN domain
MSRRDPRITLAQIRDAADKARSLCAAHTLDSLLADWKATAAPERCIEIVGRPRVKQERPDASPRENGARENGASHQIWVGPPRFLA